MKTSPLLAGEVAELPRRRRPPVLALAIVVIAMAWLGAGLTIILAIAFGLQVAEWLS